MKCGVLTFHKTTNYGAVLQAYALMHTIAEFPGTDCEILDYRCAAVERRYKIFRKYDTLRELVKASMCAVPNAILQHKFLDFLRKYCKLSAPIMPEELSEEIQKYDMVVVGSDQIWNPKLTGYDENYFLPFKIKGKKVAYAASFGSFDDAKQIRKYYVEDISRFAAVSLREMDVVQYFGNTGKNQIQQVLDPTFLMKKADWKDTFIPKRLVKEKYIVVYKMMDADGLFDFARELGRKKGLQIIYLTHSPKREFGMKNIFTASPEEFLNYLYYAEYVVTSSFHGTALALNLNKEFYYALDTKNEAANRRIQALMVLLDLQDRNIACQDKNYNAIDWDTVNQRLEKERIKSMGFLKHALEECGANAGSDQ